MTKLPIVAIIGRPNTGKSTLFNRMIGKRKAIESAIPGTTRDHIAHTVETAEVDYLLVDTGGMGKTSDVDFEQDVFQQSLLALQHADLIIFTVHGREELTKDDRTIIDLLRKKRKRHVPVIIAITKVDNPQLTAETESAFSHLTIGDDTIVTSAAHRLGIDELNTKIIQHLNRLHFEKRIDNEQRATSKRATIPRIAIIGKPNVGKSSIINALMSEAERAHSPLLVSDVPGTTRDSTDTLVRYQEQSFILVDTAGLKKRSRLADEIEHFAMLRTILAIEQADIVVLVLDASEAVSQQDKRIARMAIDAGKGFIVLLNKIDTRRGESRKAALANVGENLPFCRFAPLIPCSAHTREGLLKLFDAIASVSRSRTRRIPTSELRSWFERVVYGQPMGEIVKSKHITQAEDVPPTFVIFVKNPKNVSVSQLRYLENRLRETFGFDGTPVRWITKTTMRK